MDAAFQELRERLDVRRSLVPLHLTPQADVLATGDVQLDRALAGGFPRGGLATIEGAGSSGRSAIAARTLAQAAHGGLVAAIDDGSLYPPALAAAGIPLDRLLIVPARTPLAVARAVDVLLRSRIVAAMTMPASSLRATSWARFATLAHRAGVVLLVVGERVPSEVAFAALLRLQCSIERVRFHGARGVLASLAGYDVRVRVLKHKRAAPGLTACVTVGEG